MRDPLLLYSTSTWLAYAIAERFYAGVHYAWCSPVYDGKKAASHFNIPPTSSPAELYRALGEEVRRGERHSELMKRNRSGILAGLKAKAAAGVISEARQEEIETIVEDSHPREFRPVLFVMPFETVRDRVVEASVRDRAHPMSIEYLVEQLPRDCFDVLELEL
ncbi:MAG TPA: hypothetical protein VF006_21125 [Longimicrobium sp.]